MTKPRLPAKLSLQGGPNKKLSTGCLIKILVYLETKKTHDSVNFCSSCYDFWSIVSCFSSSGWGGVWRSWRPGLTPRSSSNNRFKWRCLEVRRQCPFQLSSSGILFKRSSQVELQWLSNTVCSELNSTAWSNFAKKKSLKFGKVQPSIGPWRFMHISYQLRTLHFNFSLKLSRAKYWTGQ